MSIYTPKKPKRINSVSVGLTILALLVVYAFWALVPVFWPLWRVSGIMRSGCAIAYREADDAEILKMVLHDTRRTGLRLTKDNFRIERVPFSEDELAAADGFREQMMKIGRECRFRFRYVDTYKLPLLGVDYELPYESTVTLDLRPKESGSNPLYEFFYNSCTCTSVASGG